MFECSSCLLPWLRYKNGDPNDTANNVAKNLAILFSKRIDYFKNNAIPGVYASGESWYNRQVFAHEIGHLMGDYDRPPSPHGKYHGGSKWWSLV